MPWHTVLACVKVKCSHSDAPHPDLGEESSPAKDIVAQAGDYSRIHLAHRPFQLFSISLLIYGPSFNISVYDRGGVLHSPRRDIYDDNGLTADFVFVVKRLLQDLSPVELGREPGVELHGPEIEDGTANDSLSYPRFRVPALPAQPTYFAGYWTTDGRPIWTSYSLVGRGTVVWKATADPDTSNRAYVLKSAWRRACRPSEVAVYEYLRERRLTGARGIADFLAGDNVALRRADGTTAPLSINALRPADAHVEPDMVLHRVLLPSVGTPLWLFEDPAHFVRALLAVVKGIEALAEHGILHRDISIGNVLLSADPRAGHEAFLTDFEFASIREWDDAGAVDDSQGVKQESHMTV
ncbi:hypothetical protein PsYK624_059280 [Phanerochaete sordida]|uniref:Fungal-type protein kinase domain-containing protein n=1 Tax=Phanerochaete sordida TaxID=48140 RepID=A0A9P3G9B7_9APHY|nr:hypothetical protein PsYK624_059280 [Phanerochaete sordida]